jgi:hypothetical protein
MPSVYNLYFIFAVCPPYTVQPVFISAICSLNTTCIYLWCVLSIHNLYLSLLYALYTQPVLVSVACHLHNLYL